MRWIIISHVDENIHQEVESPCRACAAAILLALNELRRIALEPS